MGRGKYERTPEIREAARQRVLGKEKSEITKQRMSEAKKNKPLSPEHIEALKEGHRKARANRLAKVKKKFSK